MYVVFYAIIINEGYIKKQYSMGKTMIIKEGGELITGSQNTGKYYFCFLNFFQLSILILALRCTQQTTLMVSSLLQSKHNLLLIVHSLIAFDI